MAGRSPGCHHGGEGAVDGGGESHVQGRGEADQGGAGAQQDVGGVAAQGELARLLSAVAVLAQPDTFLLGPLPAQLTLPAHLRHGECHPLAPAHSGPGAEEDGAATLVAQHGGGRLLPPAQQSVQVGVADSGALQPQQNLPLAQITLSWQAEGLAGEDRRGLV